VAHPTGGISDARRYPAVVVLLVTVFVLVPIVELYVIVQVASAIGAWNAIGLLFAVSLIGAWLVKHQGMAVWRRAQVQINAGRAPTREAIDGVLLLCAGCLLLVPGFVTDAIGLLLLLPPVRAGIRALLGRRWSGRATVIRATYRGPIDTTATDAPPSRRDRPELGGP
jgi:UPF0716 protein FxsA